MFIAVAMAIWDMVTTILGLGAMVVIGDTVTEDGTVVGMEDGTEVITPIILITVTVTVMGMAIGNTGIHRDEGAIIITTILPKIPLGVPIAPL